MNQQGKSGEWIEEFRRLWEDGACDRQTTSIRVCLSVDAPFDGRTSGRPFMECWDRERGGGREEKFGDLICRFTRLPWPHVSRRSRLHTRPAGEVSMSGGESLE